MLCFRRPCIPIGCARWIAMFCTCPATVESVPSPLDELIPQSGLSKRTQFYPSHLCSLCGIVVVQVMGQVAGEAACATDSSGRSARAAGRTRLLMDLSSVKWLDRVWMPRPDYQSTTAKIWKSEAWLDRQRDVAIAVSQAENCLVLRSRCTFCYRTTWNRSRGSHDPRYY